MDELPFALQGLVRSMNRSARLLARCALKLEPSQRKFIARHAADTAIYCAVEPAVTSLDISRPIPPKRALQDGASLVAPSLSIVLGAEGGVHTFSHGRFACVQALRQAQIDLRLSTVRVALVCAVSSKSECSEGAVIAALTADHGMDFILSSECARGDLRFGVADPLIQTLWAPHG